MTTLPEASARVLSIAEEMGLAIAIKQMSGSTRTAEEAAIACGCDVAQIVKSLVFQGAKDGTPVLLLVSGANRVDTVQVAQAVGQQLTRPDAKFVRDATGFAIGGIPPFGHATALATYMDDDLMGFDTVWAAAGTPDTVFAVAPGALAQAVSARLLRVA